MRSPSPFHARRHRRLRPARSGLLLALVLLVGAAPAAHAAPPESAWISVDTTAQGQLLTKLREKLVSDYGQTAPLYDYGVVKKLRMNGTLNTQDYSDLRNALYAGTSIRELDLSGVVDGSAQALSGMTAMTDVSLPPVASFTLADPFQGDTSLRRVVVAADTYVFGSPTTFNGITTLERITFLHTTKPSTTQLSGAFAGSNNADAANRTVVAAVPDEDRGDYDEAPFRTMFSSVVESATADDREELQTVIDEARALPESRAGAPFRWTLLQRAITGAEAVHADATATAADVHRVRLILQTAISRLPVAELGLSIKATKDADVTLSWKNGTAQHFAEFVSYPVAKVDALSDATNDVYVPTVPVAWTSQKIASAVIPGQTDKTTKIFTHSAASANAQYQLTLTPIAGRTDTAPLIPGLAAWDNRGLYTNLGDSGVVQLDEGQHFDLDTIRTQQAQLDQINNLFIEPDYTFDVAGDSITTRKVGADGRRQLRIDAERPGVSVVKITYGPLHYLTANDNGTPGTTNWSFNGIDPQNTGLAVVQVGEAGTFATGITAKSDLDTYYFDRTVGSRDFTFTPAAGTTVRVHDPLNVSAWGTGWTTYQAAPDGSFTVKLKGGRNIVELTNGGKKRYRVLRGKAVDVAVTNATRAGQPFQAGDTARIEITGVEGGVEKLGGIYNPAFSANTWSRLTYRDPAADGTSAPTLLNSVCVNKAPTGAGCRSGSPPPSLQYQTAGTTFAIDYPYTGDGDEVLQGDMTIGGLGAEFPYHREIPLEGKPANLAAVAIGPFDFSGMPQIYVRGDQVSTTPGAPAAPTALQATYGDAKADLSWTAPTSTGGLPILGYRVRTSTDGGQTWDVRTFGPGTSRTLTDLQNGTAYQVQVAGFTSGAQGVYSSSTTVTPRTIPGVPTALAATPRRRSTDVAWTASADGGSPITGYRVRSSADGGQTWTTQDLGTTTTTTLTGLTDGTPYDVQVAALNAEGASAFTASATVTPATIRATLGAVSVSGVGRTSASVAAVVTPGDLAQDVVVETSRNAEHSDATPSAPTTVPAGSGATTVTTALSGLTAGSEIHYRVVLVAADGDRVPGAWASFRTAAPDVPTATVNVEVAPAPATLAVRTATGVVRAKTRTTVSTDGLAADEPYRITIGGVPVGTGRASATGAVSASVVVPARRSDSTVPVRVVGSHDGRAGSTDLRVVTAKRLTVKVQKAKARRGTRQRVTVTGLAAGEPVHIGYRGTRIATLTASRTGTAVRTFAVGRTTGSRTVTATGVSADRTGAKAFRVVR